MSLQEELQGPPPATARGSSTSRNGSSKTANRARTGRCFPRKSPKEIHRHSRPSGAATTLLDIIAGLEKPDKGRVMADINQCFTRAGIARYVSGSALFPWLNAFGNVMFGLKAKAWFEKLGAPEVQIFLHLVGS